LKDCTVSVKSPADGQTHTLELTALTVFNAAAQAIEAWSQLSWWEPDLTLDVKCGDRQWNVGVGQVRASQARRKR
jgi:hypothetical protein